MSLSCRLICNERCFVFVLLFAAITSEAETNSVVVVGGVMALLIVLIIGVATVIIIMLVLKIRSKETPPTG